MLKAKLAKKVEKRGAVAPPATPRRVFLFRDIFHGDTDSEDEDGGGGQS